MDSKGTFHLTSESSTQSKSIDDFDEYSPYDSDFHENSNTDPSSRRNSAVSGRRGSYLKSSMNLTPPKTDYGRPETRHSNYKESLKIIQKNETKRKEKLESFLEDREKSKNRHRNTRNQQTIRWKEKMYASPLGIDLYADYMEKTKTAQLRIQKDVQDYKKTLDNNNRNINSNITSDGSLILKSESTSIDDEITQLRKEKIALLTEEKRIKALLACEKESTSATTMHRSDRILATIANRKRQEQLIQEKKQLFKDALDNILREEMMALQFKHGLLNELPHHHTTASSSSSSSSSISLISTLKNTNKLTHEPNTTTSASATTTSASATTTSAINDNSMILNNNTNMNHHSDDNTHKDGINNKDNDKYSENEINTITSTSIIKLPKISDKTSNNNTTNIIRHSSTINRRKK